MAEKRFLTFLGTSSDDRIRCVFETYKAKINHKKAQITQQHVDRWADLMERIIKNPEIADRIPNDDNLLFGEGDIVFINGEPQRYSELIQIRPSKRKVLKAKSRLERASE